LQEHLGANYWNDIKKPERTNDLQAGENSFQDSSKSFYYCRKWLKWFGQELPKHLSSDYFATGIFAI
jgi:hypothetical protein